MIRSSTAAAAASLAALPLQAQAQTGQFDAADSGDTAWLLAATAMVLVAALPGIALVHSSRLRNGNALSVLYQVLAIVALVSLSWTLVGYTLAFGDVSGGWIGAGNAWMLIQLGTLRAGTALPESAFVFFQIALAALGPALMTGAWAERARFGWVLLFCGLWSLMVYAPVAHWVWGGGWLASSVGTLDWAGGLSIFVSAGASSLVVAAIMGRRVMPSTAEAVTRPQLAGSALIWIGGIGLCGGWALAAGDAAAAAAINAHVAMAASLLAWLAMNRLSRDPAATGAPGSAILAGLAAISGVAGYVSPGAALVIGLLGAFAARQGLALLARTRIDDALGIFAIAGLPGIVGTLMVGVFQSPELGGTGYTGDHSMISQVFAQAIGLAIVTAWSAMTSAVAALMASVLFPMRMSDQAERVGLDTSSHGIDAAV